MTHFPIVISPGNEKGDLLFDEFVIIGRLSGGTVLVADLAVGILFL